MHLKALKAAFPHTVPVLLGYLFLGFAFGVLLSSQGYSFLWAGLMSLTVYAGSGQFVAISLLTSPFDPLGAAMMTLMVNARHLFYGLSLLDSFKGAGVKKPYMIFALTDETYSLLCSAVPPADVAPHEFRFAISVLDHCYWIAASMLGAAVGSAIEFPSKGIEFVMTALFIVILIDQWEKSSSHLPALAGVGLSLLSLILFGADNFIPFAMIAILIFLLLFKKPIEKKRRKEEPHETE